MIPPAELRAAFLGTTYGLPAERLKLSTAQGKAPSWAIPASGWAIVTAWNPAGRLYSETVNRERQKRLKAVVAEQGVQFLEGFNGAGKWQEETLIIQGVRLKDAVKWGREFGQAAVVYGCGARVALIWLTPLHAERFWGTQQKA